MKFALMFALATTSLSLWAGDYQCLLRRWQEDATGGFPIELESFSIAEGVFAPLKVVPETDNLWYSCQGMDFVFECTFYRRIAPEAPVKVAHAWAPKPHWVNLHFLHTGTGANFSLECHPPGTGMPMSARHP